MIIHALHRLNQMLLLLAHSLWTHLPLLLLVLFCVALLRLLQALPRIYAFVTLPATLLHELLHAALGWLLMRNWLSNIAGSLAQRRALRPLIMAGPR